MAKKQLSKEIIRQLNDAWLNIDPNTPIINPFERLKTEDPEEFYKRLTCLFLNPDYIYFVCKHVLNIELLPMQALILQEMWQRKFPMLIGSRGLGKTFLTSLYCLLRALLIPGRKIVVVGAAFRQSKFLHEYMAGIWRNAPVLRDMCSNDSGPRASVDVCKMIINDSVVAALPIGDGSKIRGQRAHDIICLSKDTLVQTDKGLIKIKDYLDGNSYSLLNINNEFEKPSYTLVTDPADVYEIVTRNGYQFKCSNVHQVMTSKGWKKAIDLTTDDYLEIDMNDYFPETLQSYGKTVIDDDMGWFLGLAVSEGSLGNRNNIAIVNTDRKLIDLIKTRLSFDWKEYHKSAYKDGRNWDCKESWTIKVNDTELRDDLYRLGVDYTIHRDKDIPSCILRSPKSVIIQFLAGLFEGDGTGFVYEDKRDKRSHVRISYYSSSKKLCTSLQIILLKLGIISSLVKRGSNLSKNPQWAVNVNGANAINLYEIIGKYVSKWDIDYSKVAKYKERAPSIRKNGDRLIVSTNRCDVNSHIGTFDTKEECIEAFNLYWKKTRECLKVKSVTKLPDKEVLYDFHMPETHSFIGNGFVQHNCDEFASQSRDIFENVIAGFAAVSANPVDNVKNFAKEEEAKKLGINLEEYNEGSTASISNQIVLSGTAYYDFNHFAEYWKKWRSIILTGGDEKALSTNIFNGEPVPESFNWKDYSIIRIPVDLIPRKFMDEGQIARSKATVHNGIFLMEFSSCFTTDSQGFFKRSLIESCVGTDSKPIYIGDESIYFDPLLKGNKNRKYVMAIDPASEVDNFSIIILELHGTHRRIVHCWTTTRSDHTEKVAKGITKVNNFYSYCARKIRDLMKLFNIVHIAMDSQGGGYSVSEALHDLTQLEDGEIPIWPIIDPEKEAPTDDQPGLHILEMCQFANYEWYSEANHGLRKDLENKTILFPRFDPITIGLSIEEDSANNRLYDTLEDCVMEIEELKNELSMIEITQSVNGRERWDTPEVKVGVSKKKRLRKDRYSALIMANLSARKIDIEAKPSEYHSYGGFSSRSEGKKQEGATYEGPNWFTSKINNLY